MKRIQTVQIALLSECPLHVGCHNVHLVEGLRAVGTLSHTVGDTVFHAVIAKKMAAGLEDGVLEVLSADSA